MKIAVLSFDGLLEKSTNLDSLILPIEMSRINVEKQKPELIIDINYGTSNRIYFEAWDVNDINEAFNAFIITYCIKNPNHVGWIDNLSGNYNKRSKRRVGVFNIIKKWSINKEFDGVVWYDAGANFKDTLGDPFSPKLAIEYLIKNNKMSEISNYVKKLPSNISTELIEIIRSEIKREDNKNKLANAPKLPVAQPIAPKPAPKPLTNDVKDYSHTEDFYYSDVITF